MTAEKIKPKQTRTRLPKVIPNKDKIADLVLNKGIKQQEAAELTGVTQGRVSQIISDIKNNPEYNYFTTHKDKVLENLQYQLVSLANTDALKTMLNKRGFTDVAILQDKIQLLRGEATSIQAVDIRGLIGCVIKSQESGKVEGNAIDIEENKAEEP